MAEGKTSMFGKTYNTIGSTDSNFIIKTKGDLKVQWGNKFIDVIKNGKIASEGKNLLKVVTSEEEVTGTGIFIVQGEENSQVWVSVDDTKVNVSATSEDLYVSFLLQQEEITEGQKKTALRNIGFYYETMEEATSANLTSGIIFVESESSLYLIKDGAITPYQNTQVISNGNSKDDFIKYPLYIHEHSLYVKDSEYAVYENDQIRLFKRLITEDGLESRDATSEQGYRLYLENGKSYFEVDYIKVRYPEVVEDPDWEQYPLFTKKNNIVQSVEYTEDKQNLVCTLKEFNQYEVGEYIYALLDLNLVTEIINGEFKIKLSRESAKDIKIIAKYKYDDVEQSQEQTILAGQFETSFYFPEEVNNPTLIYDTTKELKEYEIIDVSDFTITVKVPDNETVEFANSVHYIFLSRSPFLHIDKNTMYNLDRSKMVVDEETGEEKPDDYPHSIFGDVKEEELEILQEPAEEKQLEEFIKPDVGLYNDKLLALNPTLYNTTFKTVRKDPVTEHPYYPKYFEEIKLPEEKKLLDKKFNYIVPDMEWIKRMLDFFFPVGTIIMYNGQSEIPPGWKICDGSNGTPNLVDRFVKGGTGVQQNDPDGVVQENGWYKYQIQENNLPYHSHPQQAHTHGIPTMYGYTGYSGSLTVYGSALTGSSGESAITSVSGEGVSSSSGYSGDSTYGGTVTSSGGDHSHDVTINGGQTYEATSYDDAKNWPNDKITIEPPSFSLIFIMKTETFVDYVNND